jgi:hypothetical protein
MKMLHTKFFFVCSKSENEVLGKVFVPNKKVRKRFNETYQELYISEIEILYNQLFSFKDYSIVPYEIKRTRIKQIKNKIQSYKLAA